MHFHPFISFKVEKSLNMLTQFERFLPTRLLGPKYLLILSDTDSLKLVAPKKKLETFRLKICHKQIDAL